MKEKHEPIDFRNHRYSSIDMARETGMSSEGLRFYERKGILQVDKDEKNGYRTYPIMKVPMMRSAKILGTYGISLDSVAEIIQDHDHHLDHLDRTLEQAEARLNHDIEWKRRCLAALREQREIISHGIGTVYFAELDEMAYLEYYGAEKLRANKKLRRQVDQCLRPAVRGSWWVRTATAQRVSWCGRPTWTFWACAKRRMCACCPRVCASAQPSPSGKKSASWQKKRLNRF